MVALHLLILGSCYAVHINALSIPDLCSMRETRETALLHAWVESPIRPHNHRQLHQLMACIFIYSTKWL